ncbi:hypothetical protein BHE90_003544 [Fusarium euwallaceae]|uniref:Fungal N-terminal domain-containing protein n=1 Tax=Fusarium euwallaceae TaxID=1147111 RepID=A0A430M213_9HYPO|nr:hypothetical protein BHE90_003544 [Fusarium euwallaceae]
MRGPSCQPSQRYKEAAEDFITITRELIELRTIASTLQRDCDDSSASSIPVELRPQTATILKNCDAVVLQVQGLVDKYMSSGKTGAAKWALRGKEDVAKLQVSLETRRNALGLTLGMISVSLTKAVKDDTTVIKEGMAEVREIATHVLKGFETLRKLEGAEQPGDRLDLGGQFMMLERSRRHDIEYLLPSGIDHYHATLDVGCELSLSIMDSPGSEDWERSRKNAFRWDEPDLFLICVDLGDPGLFGLAEENLINEVREVSPETPVVLVGCKKDVRDCPEKKWPGKEMVPVSWAAGEATARKIGAAMYIECSAKTGDVSV